MLLVLTDQQLEVLEVLKGKETEEYPLSNWYLGALYALHNHYNPDRISQAAQSLRELLEKLPRVVREIDAQGSSHDFKGMRRALYERFSKDKKRYAGEWKDKKVDGVLDKTLRKVDDYLELNQQPTRREGIQTAIAAFDPMVDQLGSEIRQAKRDEFYNLWQILEGFAHHKSEPDIEKFEQCLSTLERMIFDLLAPITSQDQHEIQSILKLSDRSEGDVERMLSLIERRGANFVFFFKHVTDASWIPVLEKRGYFSQLPNIELIDHDRMVFPFWWPILYLERISVTDPCLVVDTVLNFQDTDNPRILRDITEIALKVEPIEQSLRLQGWVSKYLKSPYHLGASDLIEKLVNHWTDSSSKAVDAALNLIKIAVPFRADPESQDKQARRRANPKDYTTQLEPRPRFDEWEYEQILKKGVRPLAEKVPYQVARMLLDATATMIRLKFHQDYLDENSGSDLSIIWCQRVNGSSRDYQDSKESLVHALTFACEKVYEKEQKSVSALDQKLQNQRWNIFKRIRQHLYALHLNEQTKPWIREMILTHEDYDKRDHLFEFQRMIRLACENFGADLLSETEKGQIFEAILSGPSKQNFRDSAGDLFTEELFEERKRHFHIMQLRPFAAVLFGKYDEYFGELKNLKEKPITDEDYEPYESEGAKWGEERSPKSIEDLKELSDQDLLLFLNKWENVHRDPDEWWVDINFEGLAGAFQSIFKEIIVIDESRLQFWIENRDRLKRPIYVKAIVSAIHDQVKLKQFDKLDQWFDFCEWVLSHPDHPREEGINRSDVSRRHPDWQSSRRAVGDFVGMCLKEDINVPISVRQLLISLLDKLCTQYDRRLDEDEPVFLNLDNQLNEAINNIRSQALEHLVDFGYWVRRQSEDNQADTPEVFAILDKRLDSECEHVLTLPEYAILGLNYGRICDLGREWAILHKSDLLPQGKLPAWTEAFENFLRYNQLNKQVFDIVQDDIEFAIENIGRLKTDSTSALGKHLFTYYLWEVYPLTGDDSLLEKFYEKTKENKERWPHLFDYVGRFLKNSGKQLESGLKQRIIDFFDWRFEKKEPSELKKFAFWMEAECLDAEWRLKSNSSILDICGSGDIEIYTQVDALRGMLEDHTALVVECFAKLTDCAIRNDETIYIQTDKARPILQAGLNSDDETVRANAKRAHDNLLRRGHSDPLDMED